MVLILARDCVVAPRGRTPSVRRTEAHAAANKRVIVAWETLWSRTSRVSVRDGGGVLAGGARDCCKLEFGSERLPLGVARDWFARL